MCPAAPGTHQEEGRGNGQQVTVKAFNTKEHNHTFTRDPEGPPAMPEPPTPTPRTLSIGVVSRVAMLKGCPINRAKANRVGTREMAYVLTLWAQAPARLRGLRRPSSYLKLRPVHGHVRPVVDSEPPQVVHRISSSDALLQVVVNVFVAE